MSSPTPGSILVNKPYKSLDNSNKMYYITSIIISMIICVALIGFASYHTINNSNKVDIIAIISGISGIIGMVSVGVIGYLIFKPIQPSTTFV